MLHHASSCFCLGSRTMSRWQWLPWQPSLYGARDRGLLQRNVQVQGDGRTRAEQGKAKVARSNDER
jgi:hypothetical protein